MTLPSLHASRRVRSTAGVPRGVDSLSRYTILFVHRSLRFKWRGRPPSIARVENAVSARSTAGTALVVVKSVRSGSELVARGHHRTAASSSDGGGGEGVVAAVLKTVFVVRDVVRGHRAPGLALVRHLPPQILQPPLHESLGVFRHHHRSVVESPSAEIVAVASAAQPGAKLSQHAQLRVVSHASLRSNLPEPLQHDSRRRRLQRRHPSETILGAVVAIAVERALLPPRVVVAGPRALEPVAKKPLRRRLEDGNAPLDTLSVRVG